MPKQTAIPTKVCEESIADLDAQARWLAERVSHVLDGKLAPPRTERVIAVMINNERARARITKVSCDHNDLIVCEATAISEADVSLHHIITMTHRNGRWNVVVRYAWAMADQEDLTQLVEP